MCFLKCGLLFWKEGKSYVGQKWLNKKGGQVLSCVSDAKTAEIKSAMCAGVLS